MNAPRKKTVLVIGGAGYIGSVLVGQLLASGYRVRVLDALFYDNEAALAAYRADAAFEFIRGDFRDQSAVDRAVSGADSVVLLAALVGDPLCRRHPDLARDINDVGTTQLIDKLTGRGLERLVFMSTCSNYGLRTTDEEAVETSELKPQSLYAETKVKIERHLLESAGRSDFHPVILRCATAYGQSPRMRLDLTVNEFTYELAAGHELVVYDADTWRPYCHVADISGAITTVLEASVDEVSGEVFNVGRSGENYTKRMLVDILLGLLPDAAVRYREGSVDPRNYRVSFDKMATRLGFAGNRNIPKTIRELLYTFRDVAVGLVDKSKPFHSNIL